MRGDIPSVPQYAFIARCSVKTQGQLYLYHSRFKMYLWIPCGKDDDVDGVLFEPRCFRVGYTSLRNVSRANPSPVLHPACPIRAVYHDMTLAPGGKCFRSWVDELKHCLGPIGCIEQL
jgi:hypothetical protein